MKNAKTRKLLLGKIVRPHSIHGEVKVNLTPEYADAVCDLTHVFLNEDSTPRKILRCRIHQGAALLTLEHVLTRNDAESLRGARVYVLESDLPQRDEGEYYAHELIGARVYNEGEILIGDVVEVMGTGSNDVYVIKKTDQKELLLPAIESVILTLDIPHKRMIVRVPDGL